MHSIFKKAYENNIVIALLVGLLIWFIFLTRYILAIIFIAFIVASSFLPFVNFLHRKKVPRVIASLIPFIILIGFITAVVVPSAPSISEQLSSLGGNLVDYIYVVTDRLSPFIGSESLRDGIVQGLDRVTESFLLQADKLLETVFGIFSIFIMSFYMLFDFPNIKKRILYKSGDRVRMEKFINELQTEIGRWLRGQLIVSLVVGVAVFISLSILGVPLNLALALIAAVLEIVPYLGPILAAIPILIVSLSVSVPTTLKVLAVLLSIQVIENNLLLPQAMKYTTHMNPLVVIIVILVGGTLMGVVGALLAIPVYIFVKVCINNLKDEVVEIRAS